MTEGIRVLAPPPPSAEAILSRGAILDGLVGAEEFVEFLTLPAYRYLE